MLKYLGISKKIISQSTCCVLRMVRFAIGYLIRNTKYAIIVLANLMLGTALSIRLIFALTIGLATLLAGVNQFVAVSPTAAQGGTTSPEGATSPEKPFQLPFVEPSGPETWLMAQPYGNTTGAYRQRFTTYGASGGIHFGIDLSAPCGTEAVALADGVVFAVDGPFGSPPHNLMVDHPQLGYASMYGHLLQAPDLQPGDVVKQGEVIALTGDSGETCYGRPHLHLEIRDLAHITKYNPVNLVEANWNNLALTGNDGRDFAHDLAQPRKWQTLYDQPQARTGGPIINDFAEAWPLDWRQQTSRAQASSIEATSPATTTAIIIPLRSSSIGQQITQGNCCTNFYWAKDSTEIRFIDRPSPAEAVGIWGVNPAQPDSGPHLVSQQLGVYSPDGKLVAYPDRVKGVAVVERLADGERWEIDTEERALNFTRDSQRIIWTTFDDDAPSDTREAVTWLAEVDGTNAREVLRTRRVDAITWLADDTLLMSRRISGTSDQELFTLSLTDGSEQRLIDRLPRLRGLTFSPNKRYMVYYVTFEPEAEKNGVWLLDLRNPEKDPVKLPFFGTYRWRTNQRLIYVPFEPEASQHDFYEYNILTKSSRLLFPQGTGLTIANNDWQVSPNGRHIALVAANGAELEGIWVLANDF